MLLLKMLQKSAIKKNSPYIATCGHLSIYLSTHGYGRISDSPHVLFLSERTKERRRGKGAPLPHRRRKGKDSTVTSP
jgi:hypothetical protein